MGYWRTALAFSTHHRLQFVQAGCKRSDLCLLLVNDGLLFLHPLNQDRNKPVVIHGLELGSRFDQFTFAIELVGVVHIHD